MRLAEIDPETWVGSRNQKLTFSQPASPTACPPYWRLSDKGRGPMRYAAKSDLGSSDGRISTSCPFFTLPARPEAGLWNDRIKWPEDNSVTNVVILEMLCLCSKAFEKCPLSAGHQPAADVCRHGTIDYPPANRTIPVQR